MVVNEINCTSDSMDFEVENFNPDIDLFSKGSESLNFGVINADSASSNYPD